jgi:hypothetical protein
MCSARKLPLWKILSDCVPDAISGGLGRLVAALCCPGSILTVISEKGYPSAGVLQTAPEMLEVPLSFPPEEFQNGSPVEESRKKPLRHFFHAGPRPGTRPTSSQRVHLKLCASHYERCNESAFAELSSSSALSLHLPSQFRRGPVNIHLEIATDGFVVLDETVTLHRRKDVFDYRDRLI